MTKPEFEMNGEGALGVKDVPLKDKHRMPVTNTRRRKKGRRYACHDDMTRYDLSVSRILRGMEMDLSRLSLSRLEI